MTSTEEHCMEFLLIAIALAFWFLWMELFTPRVGVKKIVPTKKAPDVEEDTYDWEMAVAEVANYHVSGMCSPVYTRGTLPLRGTGPVGQ